MLSYASSAVRSMPPTIRKTLLGLAVLPREELTAGGLCLWRFASKLLLGLLCCSCTILVKWPNRSMPWLNWKDPGKPHKNQCVAPSLNLIYTVLALLFMKHIVVSQTTDRIWKLTNLHQNKIPETRIWITQPHTITSGGYLTYCHTYGWHLPIW